MKKRRYQIAAWMLSIMMITGSLSGSVFAAETSGEIAEASVVEAIEESTQSQTTDETTDQGAEKELEQEGVENEEETTCKTEELSVELAQEDEISNQSKQEEIEDEIDDTGNAILNNAETIETHTEEDVEESTSEGGASTEEETTIITVPAEQGSSKKDALETVEVKEENDYIPEETIITYLGSGITYIEYEVPDDLNVHVEIDPNLNIQYIFCDGAYTFTSKTQEIRYVPFGVGSGTIKVIDTDNNKVLKQFNMVIEPSPIAEITICKGTYIWTDVYTVPSPLLDWDEPEGLSIKVKNNEENIDFLDYCQGTTNYPIPFNDFNIAVKGEQVGDYTVSYYSGSEKDVYSKIIYHVVDHDYKENSVFTEATCTEDGLVEKECSNCHNIITETIPATGHIWKESYTVDQEATCTKEGTESIHCSVCGFIKEDSEHIIPMTAHAYGDWKVTKEATCTEDGSKERVCEDCGGKDTEIIPSAGHIWNEDYTIDKEATCTEEGTESIRCSVCDAIDEETVHAIPKKEHAYGDWTVTKEATCTEAGIKEKTCKDCNDKVTEAIPATGHTWNEEYTIDKEATYTEEGSESIHCSICGEIKEGTSRPTEKLLKPMSMLTVSGIVDKTYTGDALSQSPVVMDDSITLKEGTDYTVSYKNNTNAGTATATIIGKGNYTGTKDVTFKINPATISNTSVSGLTAKTYTGKALTHSVVVKSGSVTLKEGTDYTVSYKNNTNAGTATIIFIGKGNYTGTRTSSFVIQKAVQNISIKVSAASIAVEKTATVSMTGAVGAKSYKSSLATVAAVNAAGTITAKKVGSTTITATAAATANYKAASKTVSIKVVPAATSSITAENLATGIRLTWKSVAGATGYKVYRGSALIKTVTGGSTVTCTDSTANANGTTYTFRVVPTAPTGAGLAKTLAAYRIARPAVSSVKNTAARKMTVRWGKNAKATGYQIQYSTNKKFASGNKTVNITKAATVSRVIGSLTKGKTYYVRIRTYKTVGNTKWWSAWSPAKTVKITK